jgi:hypothetical protein
MRSISSDDDQMVDCEFSHDAIGAPFNFQPFLGNGVSVHATAMEPTSPMHLCLETHREGEGRARDNRLDQGMLRDLLDLSDAGDKVRWPHGLDAAAARQVLSTRCSQDEVDHPASSHDGGSTGEERCELTVRGLGDTVPSPAGLGKA